MWPFKANTKATAMSGIATCDGNKHHWSIWTSYDCPMSTFFYKTGNTFDYSEARQKRHCVICGFIEDIKIK